MDYVQFTPKQRDEMLRAVGAASMNDLLKQIPDEYRMREPLKIPAGMDELSLRAHLSELSGQKQACRCESLLSRGGGV